MNQREERGLDADEDSKNFSPEHLASRGADQTDQRHDKQKAIQRSYADGEQGLLEYS